MPAWSEQGLAVMYAMLQQSILLQHGSIMVLEIMYQLKNL